MPNVLEKIVAQKWSEIAEAKRRRPFAELEARLADAPPVRDFVEALRQAEGMGLIAEIKKASPSAGVIRADFDPVAIAGIYAEHGASCLSVLTDEQFFQGRLEDLIAVRRAVSLPVLRKDFVLDPYQVLEARVAGADCVLLIAECLDDSALSDLYETARQFGMSALIEIFEPANLDRVLKLEPPMLGINNRNLKTFATDLGQTIKLRDRIPASCLVISESGIRTREDVLRLERAGVKGLLVGESLMRSNPIGEKVWELLGR